jgi:hypothetical protein
MLLGLTIPDKLIVQHLDFDKMLKLNQSAARKDGLPYPSNRGFDSADTVHNMDGVSVLNMAEEVRSSRREQGGYQDMKAENIILKPNLEETAFVEPEPHTVPYVTAHALGGAG